MEVSTRQLRAFRLAAQHQSFARAAEALYITPSGLSVLIKELESRVGFRLFDRTTRHVELTPDGRQLLAVIQRSLEELDVAIANIGRGAKQKRQFISLGTTPLVAANILPPAMREFRKLRPDVQIQLFDADLPTLIQMVEAGKLNVGDEFFPGLRRKAINRACGVGCITNENKLVLLGHAHATTTVAAPRHAPADRTQSRAFY